MANLTHLLQNNLKAIMSTMETLMFVSKDAYDAYWDTDANTKVGALSAGVQALVEPQVKKEDYQNMTTFVDNVWKFFNNTAVGAVDHLAYTNAFKHGTYYATPLNADISPATESVGAMLESCANMGIQLLEQCRCAQNIYNDNEITDIVAVLDGERIIFGSDMTRNDLANAITLCAQWENFMTAVDPTEADYSVTVSKWRAY